MDDVRIIRGDGEVAVLLDDQIKGLVMGGHDCISCTATPDIKFLMDAFAFQKSIRNSDLDKQGHTIIGHIDYYFAPVHVGDEAINDAPLAPLNELGAENPSR